MYFSVRRYINIAGKTYVPCVCYALTKELEETVNKLVSEEKAYIYEEAVGFMNGKQLVKSKKTKTSKKSKKTTCTESTSTATADEVEGF